MIKRNNLEKVYSASSQDDTPDRLTPMTMVGIRLGMLCSRSLDDQGTRQKFCDAVNFLLRQPVVRRFGFGGKMPAALNLSLIALRYMMVTVVEILENMLFLQDRKKIKNPEDIGFRG